MLPAVIGSTAALALTSSKATRLLKYQTGLRGKGVTGLAMSDTADEVRLHGSAAITQVTVSIATK
jgi:hypothetical protein